MPEQGRKVDIKSLPFEERVDRFQLLVQAIGIGAGGDEEYDIRALGRKIVEFQSSQDDTQREQIKEEISGLYDKLGGSSNPKVGEAVVNVVMSEITYF